MFSYVPTVDLLTWTFGNQAVQEEDTCYIDPKDETRVLTKGDVRLLVRQLIAGFISLKQRPGFVVCLHSFNDIYYPALILGIIGAGAQFTGSNPAYTSGELAHHLRISKADVLITQPRNLQCALQAAAEAGLSYYNIFIFYDPKDTKYYGFPSWTKLLQHGEADWMSFNDKRTSETTTAILASTSGTTGLPKMAARSHLSLVAEHYAITKEERKSYKVMRLLSVPIFHAFASPLALISAIRDGAPTIITPRFDKSEFLRLLPKYQITETAVVPPLLLAFLSYTAAEKQALRSLKLAWCGGAPLDTLTQNKACQLFAPNARIVQVWGMTECGWISTFPYPEADNSGSVGRALYGFEVKLVDDSNHRIPIPTSPSLSSSSCGEILVRSPQLMQHYLSNALATSQTIDKDNWLHTGDVATLSPDGKIYIVDRKKELIKVRGWQVAPAELEGVLLTHERIVDAAVVGVSVSGAAGGGEEVPRAFVVVRPGAALTQEEVKSFLLAHLAKYKVSDCQIRFVESIPKSMSGKILRKLLREADKGVAMVVNQKEEEEERGGEVVETPPVSAMRPGGVAVRRRVVKKKKVDVVVAEIEMMVDEAVVVVK